MNPSASVILISIMIIVLIYGSELVTAGESSIKVHFGPLQKGKDGTPLAQKFIRFLERAESTIDSAFYGVRSSNRRCFYCRTRKRSKS